MAGHEMNPTSGDKSVFHVRDWKTTIFRDLKSVSSQNKTSIHLMIHLEDYALGRQWKDLRGSSDFFFGTSGTWISSMDRNRQRGIIML